MWNFPLCYATGLQRDLCIKGGSAQQEERGAGGIWVRLLPGRPAGPSCVCLGEKALSWRALPTVLHLWTLHEAVASEDGSVGSASTS